VSIEDDLADIVRAAVRAEVEPLRAALLDRPAASADAVSLDEAARRLGLSKRTLARRAKEPEHEGDPPPQVRTVLIGGRRLVPTSEIERLLAVQADGRTATDP
jgi:hypothetical protein